MSTSPIETIFRPVVLTLMVWSVALAVFAFLHLLAPTQSDTYPVLFAVIAALEATYTARFLRPRRLDSRERLALHLGEALLLLAGLQLGADIATGAAPLAGMVPRLSYATLLDGGIIALLWLQTVASTHDLEDLGRDPRDFFRLKSPLDRLRDRFFQGGAVVFALAGLTEIGLHEAINPLHGLDAHPVFSVLLYFLLGMLLLGQARYATLRGRWEREGRVTAAGIAERWTRTALTLVLGAALLSLFLPLGGAPYILDLIRVILGGVLAGGLLAAFLAALPFAKLFSLLPSNTSKGHTIGGRPPKALQHHIAHAAGLPPWVGPALIWLAILAALVFLAVMSRGHLPASSEARSLLGRLRLLLRQLWLALLRRARGYAGTLAARVPRRASPLGVPELSRGPLRGLRLSALSPREQVLYYYLSILRHAERAGLTRPPAATPAETSVMLAAAHPEAGDEIGGLTGQFVEARYSSHTVGRGDAQTARARWERIKGVLRVRRT